MRKNLDTINRLLCDTHGNTNVPSMAKEGIISLLISIVANEATSKTAGFTYEDLLRILLMFLVVLAIIHYALRIFEQLRRKKVKPEDIAGVNTREAIKNLSSARTILDRLIQEQTEVTELRNLRNQLTSLLSEINNPNVSRFISKKSATLGEFNAAEKLLIESTEKLASELTRQSKEDVDVKTITRLVDAAKNSVHSRIPLSDELKDLHIERARKEQEDAKKVPEQVSPDLTLYLSMLQTKYASYHPEILHTGDYLPKAKWEYNAGDGSVAAKLSNSSGNTLFEARWQDNSDNIVDLVQRETEALKKSSYKCLCLVNGSWSSESRDFAARFSHPALLLYLYELNSGLIYNTGNPAAKHYEFWFNQGQEYRTLSEKAMEFVQAHEYFTAQAVASALGIKVEGAEMLLGEFEKKGAVTDVSFRTDKVKKYTKGKNMEDP